MLRTELGCCRVRHHQLPKSGKPDLGVPLPRFAPAMRVLRGGGIARRRFASAQHPQAAGVASALSLVTSGSGRKYGFGMSPSLPLKWSQAIHMAL